MAGFALPNAACFHDGYAVPVPISQQGDEQLSCSELSRQIEDNQRGALALIQKDQDTKDANKRLALASVFIWWSAFWADLSQSEQVMFRSMQGRNEKLQYLKRKRGC